MKFFVVFVVQSMFIRDVGYRDVMYDVTVVTVVNDVLVCSGHCS